MGLWDNVKKVALSAKCLTGWHAGTYEPIEGREKCKLAKTCPDCGEYVTKTVHEYGEWTYLEYNSCQAQKECIYCQDLKRETVHNYKRRGKNQSCGIIEICERCNDEKVGATEHNWIKIPFTDTDLKVQGRKKCKDCGLTIEE
jgi:hypothetical protein